MDVPTSGSKWTHPYDADTEFAMSELSLQTLEAVKAGFSKAEFFKARELSFIALDEISKKICPGMKENDAIQLSNEIMKSLGAEKFWHRTYVRFGENTLKGYHDAAGPNVELGENDIYFLDIAPVFNGYEGDAGATYVVGHDAEMLRCKEDSKIIFDKVKSYWAETQASGQKLYQYAESICSEMGWQFYRNIDGHRLSDFPHQVYCKTKLSNVPFVPSPDLWILELQIRHKTRPFGAFVEDLLML